MSVTVDDVDAAVAFYTTHLGFTLLSSGTSVRRREARRLAPAPEWTDDPAGRPMPDGRKPAPGGWNRIHFVVEDLAGEIERLRTQDRIFATTS
jgi:catechol 2,3-dioxygenase-like lactoylglutathione lyase family enzyme